MTKYKENMQENLFYYCSRSLTSKVEALLSQVGDRIDLFDEDGDFFGLAVARESEEILNLLLAHYEKHHLCHPPDSAQYKLAKFRIKKTLEGIIDDDTPKNMLKILQPYLHIAPNYDDNAALKELKADPGLALEFDLAADSDISDHHEQQTTSHGHLLGDSSPLLTST